jgi:P4 family phage/plasmid primase-like protien
MTIPNRVKIKDGEILDISTSSPSQTTKTNSTSSISTDRQYTISQIQKEPLSLSIYMMEEMRELVRCNNQLYEYNGRCYDLLTEDFFHAKFHIFIRKYGIVKSWSFRKEVYASLLAMNEIPSISQFNDYASLMCIENGILDIYTRTIQPHSSKFYFDSHINVSYDPQKANEHGYACPVFMKFLADIFSNDEDAINNIIRLGGYLLDTSCKAGKMFLFDGDGGTGKSTLINAFTMFFTRSNDHTNQVTAISLDELASNSFDKKDLINSRFNQCAESKKGYIDAEEIKKIVTGDLIKVSRKFEDPVTFIPKTKIIVACNGLPKFTDTTDGIYRRLIIFKFRNKFRSQKEIDLCGYNPQKYFIKDPSLPEKFSQEKSAIFDLFLQGLIALKKDEYEFVLTEETLSLLKEYKRDSDSLREFLEDNFYVDFKEELPISDIYISFKNWHKRNIADGGFKYRSNELAKRICEVFDIKSSARKVALNTESGKYERMTCYPLKEITYTKADADAQDAISRAQLDSQQDTLSKLLYDEDLFRGQDTSTNTSTQ